MNVDRAVGLAILATVVAVVAPRPMDGADRAVAASVESSRRDAAHLALASLTATVNAQVKATASSAAPMPNPAVGARSPDRARDSKQSTTEVSGALTSAPIAVPTSFDPSSFDGTGVCPEQWVGSWTGVSVCTVRQAHVDLSGDLVAEITDVFTGTYMGDHSTGSLTFDETFTGNVFTGAGFLEGTIVDGSGDPTFQCSRGHITIPLYFNAAAAYGGYEGTWSHGCPAGTMHPLPPSPSPDGTVLDGGLLSVPSAVPTWGDPRTFEFTGLAPVEWAGALTGQSVGDILWAHVDPSTGELRARVIETLTATYSADHSAGTLVLDEIVTGNLLTGAAMIEADIVSGAGDPSFQCSSGHVSMPFFINAAGSVGGYRGVWQHGCGL